MISTHSFSRTLTAAAAALFCAGAPAAVSSVSAQADSVYRVSLNSAGFLTDLPKKASVKVTGGAGQSEFTVKRASNGETVFTGALGSNVNNTDTRDTIRVADFSAFKTPGRYYVATASSRSPEFDIADTALNDAYRAMMLGMYLWRCGTAVDATYKGKRYQHAACHLNDGNLQYVGGGGTKAATKGWHDAGDYNKYIVNSGVTVGLMLKAWEHHGDALKDIGLIAVQNEGNIPAYLSEVKWNLDWVAAMQLDDGKVSHKMSTRAFCGFIMPEEETAVRYFVPWGTAATASFAAMLAQASRVYAPYDAELSAKWLNYAKKSYDVLAANKFVSADQSAFSTGTYANRDDADQRLWAAAEMWEATGEDKYLKDFEDRAIANVAAHLGWGDVNALAALTYLSSERPGRKQSRVDSLRANLITQANSIVSNTTTHGYGRAFGNASSSYYWGAHGALTANTYLLNVAYKLTGDKKYREAGHEIVGHILGRNYFGRSFVTGVGHYPPVDPHDRRSIASKNPWPGYLIGGPHSSNLKETNGDPIAPPGATCASAAVCYFDYYEDYARNEIAINWNGSMIYALSGYVSVPGSQSGLLPGRNVKTASSAPKIKTTRIVQVRNGRATSTIPPGAKIYGLNGKLAAQRKVGDANIPALRRNGVFIMKVDAGAVR